MQAKNTKFKIPLHFIPCTKLEKYSNFSSHYVQRSHIFYDTPQPSCFPSEWSPQARDTASLVKEAATYCCYRVIISADIGILADILYFIV